MSRACCLRGGRGADYALILGVPAVRKGWMSRHGHRLTGRDMDGNLTCPESGYRYREVEPGVIRCLDWPEDEPLERLDAAVPQLRRS